MTGLTISPQVQKGALVGLDLFNPLSSVAIFQYNPEQITRSIAPNYSQAGGGRAEPLRLAGPPSETISANLKMDLIDQMEEGENGPLGGGISGYLAAIEMMVYPKTIAVAINQALMLAGTMEVVPPAAPLTLFIYGWKRVVPVKIESLSITETAHDPALNPIRADVAVSMKVLTYNDLSMTNPGYWAFLTHQVVKETLATVASVNNIADVAGNLEI
ncbi:hypothetical protein [Ensifer sp. 1H6]|uniref:hypothetical protein n=1 Tax=Ensifer sp. 1H6 TaxID=1911585 RepID=UPI0009C60678|nr:hypothetical protein [Ensifer sp. 1H6]OMQ35353.1 hypothetical protein BKP54_32125 [Ensifer sp. 1H6]